MKKALMVLGFALCGTFAFAQTCNFNAIVEKTTLHRSAAPTTIERPVDYKASIFTKTEVELGSWEFAASEMSDIVCGTAGCVGANTVIGGEAVAPHGQTGAAQMWTRVADSADLYTNSTWGQVNSDNIKPAIARYMQSYYTGNDNGYMLVVPADAIGSGVHNCFIGFPAVDRGTAQVIDVRFIQGYVNFYDRCFIDYKVGSAWNTREINIDGVDCDINSWGPVRASYTMPLELAQQNNIEIRIRWFSDATHNGNPVSAYGYFWAIDNVKIIAGEPDRWITNSQKFLDGFYGTMPQGMSIPITWYGEAINTGANTRNGIMLNIKHIDNTLQNSTTILSESINSIAPDPTTISYMIADERGFFQGEQDNRPNGNVFEAGNIGGSHLGYWWYGPNYGATSINPNAYGLAGLPVSTLGQQFFAATASSTGADDIAWDTVAYQVVGETGGDGSLSIAGYRWAHDNGIIPSGSLYQFGFTNDGQYVTDECPRWNKAQYIVMNRFTTGNTIPTDWVFRGVEIVPQTVDALSDIAGSSVYPMMWEAVWNADSNDWDLVDVATGFSTTIPYTVTSGDLNDLATGRLAPSDDYNAVNLQFYNQPVLKPNTSYYIGYQLAEDGKFGAAKMQYSYLANDGQTYIGYYRDQNSEVANGYYQFNPGAYDMYIYDPGRGGYFAGYNSDYCAHIRPIVGPRVALTEYHINATCGNGVEIDDDQFEGICDGYATTYAGASPTIYIIPEGGFCDTCTGAYKIDENNIVIDGNVVDIDEEYNDFTIAERNYTVYNADSSQTGLRRSYYAVTFINVNGNHSVSANATWNTFQWDSVGIDPAALNVSLGLQPNPATNSVKLNISGVTGMVNCSIIDMSGRVVYNAKINAEQQQVIDLSNVAAGAYFVRVTNDNFSKVEKLIVR